MFAFVPKYKQTTSTLPVHVCVRNTSNPKFVPKYKQTTSTLPPPHTPKKTDRQTDRHIICVGGRAKEDFVFALEVL